MTPPVRTRPPGCLGFFVNDFPRRAHGGKRERTVLITRIAFWPNLPRHVMELAESVCPDAYELTWIPEDISEAELCEAIGGFEYLMGFPFRTLSPQTYRAFGRLKLWQLLSAGYDKLDGDQIAEHGVTVCTGGGANAISVAEHAVMLMLATLRRVAEFDGLIRSGKYVPLGTGGHRTHELYGKTVGIIGLGAIGREVARRLTGFGCRLVYSDPRAASAEEHAELGLVRVELPELFASSDIITLHAPLTDATRQLFDAAAFERIKPGCVLVNTARADLIDEQALVAALESGRLGAAGLDVFSVQPPPADHPLLKLGGRVVLTPHMGGPTWESWPRRFANGFDNVERVVRGEAPRWRIFTEGR